jgi:hypothetical protein
VLGIVCALLRGLLPFPIECASLIFPTVLLVVGLGAGIFWCGFFLCRAGLGHLPVGLFRPVMISLSALLPLLLTHLRGGYRESPLQPG